MSEVEILPNLFWISNLISVQVLNKITYEIQIGEVGTVLNSGANLCIKNCAYTLRPT